MLQIWQVYRLDVILQDPSHSITRAVVRFPSSVIRLLGQLGPYTRFPIKSCDTKFAMNFTNSIAEVNLRHKSFRKK